MCAFVSKILCRILLCAELVIWKDWLFWNAGNTSPWFAQSLMCGLCSSIINQGIFPRRLLVGLGFTQDTLDLKLSNCFSWYFCWILAWKSTWNFLYQIDKINITTNLQRISCRTTSNTLKRRLIISAFERCPWFFYNIVRQTDS